MNIERLNPNQKELRRRIIEISYESNYSHLGSCLSAIDLIDSVYGIKKGHEKFCLSNGHAGIALYAVLEKYGILSAEQIKNLNVHPDRNPLLGIDVSTGSLGQGLPIALGMALADKDKDVYCLISDGESAEGSIWESLRIADEQKVENLKILVSANGWGAYGAVDVIKLQRRLKSFNDNVILLDGHNPEEVMNALYIRPQSNPLVLLAKTEVEQFPFLRGLDAHYYTMKAEDFNLAMEMLK